jgi:hypothetical protein
MTTRTPQVHLFGNLGGDPETKTLSGRTFNREVYDAILDDAVEKEYTTPDRELLVASLAVNYKTQDGTFQTRWIRLVDHQHLLRLHRKGDKIRVDGFFRNRPGPDLAANPVWLHHRRATASHVEPAQRPPRRLRANDPVRHTLQAPLRLRATDFQPPVL